MGPSGLGSVSLVPHSINWIQLRGYFGPFSPLLAVNERQDIYKIPEEFRVGKKIKIISRIIPFHDVFIFNPSVVEISCCGISHSSFPGCRTGTDAAINPRICRTIFSR
jgi:hypothetical protein